MNEEEIREMQEEAERREKARQERGGATDEQLNQAYKELQNPKDPRREEKFLEERAKRKKAEEEGDDPNIAGTAGGLGFEVAAGVATDKATAFLLNPLLGPKGIALYGLANFASGAVANAIAQRMRGDKSFSLGEILASGAAGIIPGTTAKLGKKGSKILGEANTIKRAAIAGGLTGVGSEQIRVGIDEKRPLTFNEAALAGVVGGTASASLQRIARGASNIANDYYQGLQDNAITVYAAKPSTGIGPSFVDPDGQGQLFSAAQQARLTVSRPPGMTLAAFNALKDGGMLVDVMPISNAADISQFSRGFVSALTNPNFGIGNFVVARNAAIADFGEKYYQLTRSVARPGFLAPELDHTTPLKVTGHILFPGSTRKQIKEYIDILYDEGLYAGDDPANLRLLPGEVHQVATNWVTTNLGRHGQLFLQKMSVLGLPRTQAGNYTHGAKRQIAKLYAKEVKQLKAKVSEAYEQFDLLYDFSTPGLGGYREKLDQFVDVLTRMDPDSPVTLQSIRDIATGASQGTPYIFENLSETIENLRIARSKGAEAFDNLFRLEKTGAPDAQIQAAQRAANRFMNEADDLQLMLNKIIRGTIE